MSATRLYEVLFRYHADGRIAAHAVDIAELKSGDTVIAANVLPARAIEPEDIQAVMSGEAAALAVALSVAQANERAAVEAKVEAVKKAAEAYAARDAAFKANDALSSAWAAAQQADPV